MISVAHRVSGIDQDVLADADAKTAVRRRQTGECNIVNDWPTEPHYRRTLCNIVDCKQTEPFYRRWADLRSRAQPAM